MNALRGGVKKSQNVSFPFLYCPVIPAVSQNNCFGEDLGIPEVLRMSRRSRGKHEHEQRHKARTENEQPGLRSAAPGINTASFARASPFHSRRSSAVIAGETIDRPYLITEIRAPNFSSNSPLLEGMRRRVLFKGRIRNRHLHKVAEPAFCSFPLY